MFPASYLPLAALGLDLLLRDPRSLPHPVRAVGALLDGLESVARRFPAHLKLAGVLCTLLAAAASAGVVGLACALPLAGGLLALYFAYAGLALGSLLADCRAVARHLEQGDLGAAKAGLAMLVSRDVDALDHDGCCKALAETLSENLNDGFVAPFFYLVLFGPAGMWAYKAVSTMDSMWGYKTEEWRELGWAAARCDDVLAFVPARLTALFLMLAGRAMGLGPVSFDALRRDAAKAASPNAGWPMAAAAWLAGAPVGGSAVYFGRRKEKPVLGPTHGPAWDAPRLRTLLRLCLAAGVAFALCTVLLSALLR